LLYKGKKKAVQRFFDFAQLAQHGESTEKKNRTTHIALSSPGLNLYKFSNDDKEVQTPTTTQNHKRRKQTLAHKLPPFPSGLHHRKGRPWNPDRPLVCNKYF
jgi:hypothetical protein